MLCGDCLDFARNPAILNAHFGCTLKSSWTACKASASEGCELRLLIKGHYDGPGEKNDHGRILSATSLLRFASPTTQSLRLLCLARHSALQIYFPFIESMANTETWMTQQLSTRELQEILRVCRSTHA